jgi:hypothetical protein
LDPPCWKKEGPAGEVVLAGIKLKPVAGDHNDRA